MGDTSLTIGSLAPDFRELPGADGRDYSLQDFDDAKVLVVVFSCNHCPYVRAYEERMITFQTGFSKRGVQLVAINANDAVNYPDDDFSGMVRRAKEKGFNFPYLRDEDQKVASAFGATHTPEFFVFGPREGKGRSLMYYGKMDDNYQDASSVRHHYLRDAVEAVLQGTPVSVPETHSIGCTIKWQQ